jgi:hypothetical protein
MKLKNLKKFEDFYYYGEDSPKAEERDGLNPDDLFRQHDTEFPGSVNDMLSKEEEEEYCEPCDTEEEEEEDNFETEERPWGDESVRLEKFSTFNEKKKEKKDDKEDKKPDFKDFDKDGDKKEPMTKALKDKEEKEKKEDKGVKKFEKPKKGEIPAALKKYQDKKKK